MFDRVFMAAGHRASVVVVIASCSDDGADTGDRPVSSAGTVTRSSAPITSGGPGSTTSVTAEPVEGTLPRCCHWRQDSNVSTSRSRRSPIRRRSTSSVPDLQPALGGAARQRRGRRLLDAVLRRVRGRPDTPVPNTDRRPFDAATCELVEGLSPEDRELQLRAARRADCWLESRPLVPVCSPSAHDRRRDSLAGLITAASGDRGRGDETGGHRRQVPSPPTSTEAINRWARSRLVPQVVDAGDVRVFSAGRHRRLARHRRPRSCSAPAASQIGTGVPVVPPPSRLSELQPPPLRSAAAALSTADSPNRCRSTGAQRTSTAI